MQEDLFPLFFIFHSFYAHPGYIYFIKDLVKTIYFCISNILIYFEMSFIFHNIYLIIFNVETVMQFFLWKPW